MDEFLNQIAVSPMGAIILPPRDHAPENGQVTRSPVPARPDPKTWGTAPDAIASQQAMLAATQEAMEQRGAG